jgi:hypothetical protein
MGLGPWAVSQSAARGRAAVKNPPFGASGELW